MEKAFEYKMWHISYLFIYIRYSLLAQLLFTRCIIEINSNYGLMVMFSLVHVLHIVLTLCVVPAVLILEGKAFQILELRRKKELLPRPLEKSRVFNLGTDLKPMLSPCPCTR